MRENACGVFLKFNRIKAFTYVPRRLRLCHGLIPPDELHKGYSTLNCTLHMVQGNEVRMLGAAAVFPSMVGRALEAGSCVHTYILGG